MFIAAQMGHGDRLGHSWREGRLLFPGLASDHAAMIRAALALYEATGERGYLERALAWQATLDRHYANAGNGGYFLTADDAEGLVVRPERHHRRRHAEPERGGRAEPGAARGAHRPACLARAGRPPVRRRAGECRRESVRASRVCSTRSTCGCAAPRSSSPAGEAPPSFSTAARRLPFLDRIVLHAPDPASLPTTHPAQEKIKRRVGARPSSASAKPARCR